MKVEPVQLDPDGLFLNPKVDQATLYGLVLDPGNSLRLFLERKDQGRLELILPRVTRLFVSPDLTTGTGFEPRTQLFEMIYGPVTEETVISVVENMEMMEAETTGIERLVRAASYALEWITVKGSNGLALSEASPDELSWLAGS